MITDFIINTTARCPQPDEKCSGINLGKPVEVVETDDGRFTVYACQNCEFNWHRPHNPLPEEELHQTV